MRNFQHHMLCGNALLVGSFLLLHLSFLFFDFRKEITMWSLLLSQSPILHLLSGTKGSFVSSSIASTSNIITLLSLSDSQTFYAMHPNGAYSFGQSLLFNSSALSHAWFCFSSFLTSIFYDPLFLLFSRTMGSFGSAGKNDMISYLKKSEHLKLPLVGFEEAPLTSTK